MREFFRDVWDAREAKFQTPNPKRQKNPKLRNSKWSHERRLAGARRYET
jgi:hypothetical protein